MLVLKTRTVVNIYYEQREDGSIVEIREVLSFDFDSKSYKLKSLIIKTIQGGGQ